MDILNMQLLAEMSGEQHVQYDPRSSMEGSHGSPAPKVEYYGNESGLRVARVGEDYHHLPAQSEAMASHRNSQD